MAASVNSRDVDSDSCPPLESASSHSGVTVLLLFLGLRRHVMADDATGDGTGDGVVTSHMSRHAANHGALDTARCHRRLAETEQQGG